MNNLPPGTYIDLIEIKKISDVKKLTDRGVKGCPKVFKVDKTFLKHNVPHLLSSRRGKGLSTITPHNLA